MSDAALKLLESMSARLALMEAKLGALPDKAEVYKAALAVHGLVWASIVGTVAGLKAFGLL